MAGLYRIINKNGTKQVQAFSGVDVIANPSVPVGAILPMYTTTVPSGYLPCNGAEYDIEQFPLLYQVLQTNVLPDLRECVLVGVGTNETDEIDTHDVYMIDEFKDDQFQGHYHRLQGSWVSRGSGSGSAGLVSNYSWNYLDPYQAADIKDGVHGNVRVGTTTHSKQKGVFYIIKATSNIEDIQSNAEISDIIKKIEERLQQDIDKYEDGWVDTKVSNYLADYYGEKVLYESTATNVNLVANTELADSIYNFREVKFYLRRSAALTANAVVVFTIDQDTMKAMKETTNPNSNYQLIIPGYGSEYRQLTFNEDGNVITYTSGAECIWKIVGVGK